ncbi:MAG TPA: methyltransferase type 11, partial [Opitutaceae bacterium]|nr:methyltransferase type 11 [Opitutaceae bacterium]
DAPPEFSPDNVDYYAAQGLATRLFWWGEARDRLEGWRLREIAPLACFAYFAAGGFSGLQIGGRFVQGLMHGFDRVAAIFPRALAGRLLVVLEKETL